MLVVGDVKGLEWVTVNWLAQDQVGMKEILAGVDHHAENQATFKLPDRKTAKIFIFRLIYGGTEYSYTLDPDFNWISKKASFWFDRIEAFYDKYKGIKRQHTKWVQEATRTGKIVMPTGRFFPYAPKRNRRGEMEWPRTQILNYPVQGTGADVVAVLRVRLGVELDKLDCRNDIKLVSTVHDSVVVDCKESLVPTLARCFGNCSVSFNADFERLFDVPFNLPIEVELKAGNDMLHLEAI